VGGTPAWGMGGGLTTLPRKTQYLLRITTHSLGTGRITWHNLSTGKWTCHLEDQGVGGKMWSEWILGWIGFDWLRTGIGGGLL
jgi:hypothetical protein